MSSLKTLQIDPNLFSMGKKKQKIKKKKKKLLIIMIISILKK